MKKIIKANLHSFNSMTHILYSTEQYRQIQKSLSKETILYYSIGIGYNDDIFFSDRTFYF